MQTKITKKEHAFFPFEDVASQNVGTGYAFPHDLCLFFPFGAKSTRTRREIDRKILQKSEKRDKQRKQIELFNGTASQNVCMCQ